MIARRIQACVIRIDAATMIGVCAQFGGHRVARDHEGIGGKDRIAHGAVTRQRVIGFRKMRAMEAPRDTEIAIDRL